MRMLLVGLVLAVGTTLGCGGDEGPAGSVCARLDKCNLLATGVSVDDCTETVDRELDDMNSAERADALRGLGDCLKFESCSAFGECMDEQ